MQMDLEKVEAIFRWLSPKNLQELQIFLGISVFFSDDTFKITQKFWFQWLIIWLKSKEISWGEAQQKSFKKLKVALAVAPILDIVDPNELFVLETDASGEAIGAVLMQGGHPVAFESKKLDRAHYSFYKQELLAIVHAKKKWRHYLYWATFEAQTNHESLKWLLVRRNWLVGRCIGRRSYKNLNYSYVTKMVNIILWQTRWVICRW